MDDYNRLQKDLDVVNETINWYTQRGLVVPWYYIDEKNKIMSDMVDIEQYQILEDIEEPEFEPILNMLKDAECLHLVKVEDHYGTTWFNDGIFDNQFSVVRCSDCGMEFYNGKEDDDGGDF